GDARSSPKRPMWVPLETHRRETEDPFRLQSNHQRSDSLDERISRRRHTRNSSAQLYKGPCTTKRGFFISPQSLLDTGPRRQHETKSYSIFERLVGPLAPVR